MKLKIRLALAALTFVCGTAHAAVMNLVTNGSFEQGALSIGSFQGWQTNLGDANTYVDSGGQTGTHYGQASDGLWAAYFGSTLAGGGSTISQTLTTAINQSYLLTFDLANDNGGLAARNNLLVSVGGKSAISLINLANQNYVLEEYSFTASSNATVLSIFGYNDQSYLELDHFVVTAVPEPATSMLFLAGLISLGFAFRTKLRVR